ncbi:ribosome silencing factor [Ideonella sp.]|uniref:ribosome silencing factor n=1 Tax=Ideonella sp. TaxID=1929293 RepID=UPI0035AE79E0
MDIRKLQRAIVDGLEDVKAQHIVVFNTEHLSPLFERVIVASGTSNRQTKALAASVRDAVKSSGQQVLRTEGEDNGEWIIVDCGAAVAHIMQPAIRDYYRLEEIWGGKPVKLKLADDKVSLPKASESDDEDEPAPVKKKPAAKKAPAKSAKPAQTEKSAAGRAALGKASPKRKSGKSADDAPVAVKKPAPARKVSSGKVGAAAPAAKKAPARKAAAPKPVARKAAPVKAAPVKAAAKKAAPAKKAAAPAKKAAPRKTTAR